MAKHLHAVVSGEEFIELLEKWLSSQRDVRMMKLKRFIYDIELEETEKLKETLYEYGSYLTQTNYLERKFFERMALLVRQIENDQLSV